MNTITAIDTEYKGYRFRSRLEARWAVFFDALGLRWEYEKEGFELGKLGRYLPDFWLPDVHLRGGAYGKGTSDYSENYGGGYGPGLWVEIKPTTPTDTETAKCEALRGNSVIFCGMPPGKDVDDGGYQCNPWWDNCMIWTKCYKANCGLVKVEFSEGNYMYCPRCGGTCDDRHPALTYAMNAARAARFEFGQRP